MASNVIRFPLRPRLVMRELDQLRPDPDIRRHGSFVAHEQSDGRWSLSLVWSTCENRTPKWKDILVDTTHDDVVAEARWQSLFMFSELRLNVVPGRPVVPGPGKAVTA